MIDSDMQLIREYISREYSYADESNPLEHVEIWRVDEDGEGHKTACIGDYWINDGTYGELVKIEAGAVVQKYYEGA